MPQLVREVPNALNTLKESLKFEYYCKIQKWGTKLSFPCHSTLKNVCGRIQEITVLSFLVARLFYAKVTEAYSLFLKTCLSCLILLDSSYIQILVYYFHLFII